MPSKSKKHKVSPSKEKAKTGIKKSRSNQKRNFFKYSGIAVQSAMMAVREEKMSVRAAATLYGVPKSTLHDKVQGKSAEQTGKTGPEPRLSLDGENKIAKWVINLAKSGFPIKKSDLLDTVEKILKDTKREDLFEKGRPGQKWYQNFLKRHPEISLREAESVNKARAIVTEESIRLWFQNLKNYLEVNNVLDVMEDGDRILNGDESGFSLCPKSGKVLGPKGWKNFYQIKKGNEKENLTVLICFTASGKICPPLVVFPYVRPPRAVVESIPESWVLGKSDTGWMKGDVFYEYIVNDFNKWVSDNNIKRPIILFIDGHKSHMTMALSEACERNGIILYALPPNTTHILQPADVSVFRPLKEGWRNTVRKWQNMTENINSSVTKTNFCKVFNMTLNETNMENYIKNGFRKCGLFPLNEDNVDYSKCVKNTIEKITKTRFSETNITSEECKIAEKVIAKIENSLHSYGINVNVIINEIRQLDQSQNVCLNTNENRNLGKDIKVGSIVNLDEIIIHDIEMEDPAIICDFDNNELPLDLFEERPQLDIDRPDSSLSKDAIIISHVETPNTDTIADTIANDNSENLNKDINENTMDENAENLNKDTDEDKILNDKAEYPKKDTTDTTEDIFKNDKAENLNEEAIMNGTVEIENLNRDLNDNTTMDDTSENPNKDTDEDNILIDKAGYPNKDTTDTSEDIIKNDNAENLMNDTVEIENPNRDVNDTIEDSIMNVTVENPIKNNNEDTKEKDNEVLKDITVEIIIDNDNSANLNKLPPQRSAFDKHLSYPEPIKHTKKVKEMLPSAISSEAWRKYYKNKDEEKKKKTEMIRNRKIERETKRNEMAYKKTKAGKRPIQRDKKTLKKEANSESVTTSNSLVVTSSKSIRCTSCSEILESDAEEDEEKNIGCDYCTRWYHLKCTEFIGMAYEEAAEKDYRCDLC